MKLECSNVEFAIWRKKVDKSLFEHNGTTIPEWANRMWHLPDICVGVSSRNDIRAEASVVYKGTLVTNSSWSPSSVPASLNAEFYIKKIQPRLKYLKVREIAQAIHVSQPYAAFIRSGRRRPHPRHWQVLAGLVGILA
jgi:hypothetical protein